MFNKNVASFKYMVRSGIWKQGKNNYFDPKECKAVSYDWWVYVKKIKGKVVFNNYNYSNTTCKHQTNTRSLLRELKIKIDLVVSMPESLERFESRALPSMYEDYFACQIKSKRKGIRQRTKDDALNEMNQLKLNIALARKLGARISKAEIKALWDHMHSVETNRLERLRLKNEELKAKRNALKPELDSVNEIDLGFNKLDDVNEIELGF